MVLPSPVFISAILPFESTMPPMSCTSNGLARKGLALGVHRADGLVQGRRDCDAEYGCTISPHPRAPRWAHREPRSPAGAVRVHGRRTSSARRREGLKLRLGASCITRASAGNCAGSKRSANLGLKMFPNPDRPVHRLAGDGERFDQEIASLFSFPQCGDGSRGCDCSVLLVGVRGSRPPRALIASTRQVYFLTNRSFREPIIQLRNGPMSGIPCSMTDGLAMLGSTSLTAEQISRVDRSAFMADRQSGH